MQHLLGDVAMERGWSLEAELAFIGGLGRHSAVTAAHRRTRRQLLNGYAVGLERRTHGFTPREICCLRERVEVELLHEPWAPA